MLADRNFPPFPRAMRDGFAVRASDLSQLPATLEVVGEIKAGTDYKDIPVLQPGQAIAIMTGAPAPSGADAVMVEHTTRQGQSVQVLKAVGSGGGKLFSPVLKPGAAIACCIRECSLITAPLRWLLPREEIDCWFTADLRWRCSPPATKLLTSTCNPGQRRSQIEHLLAGCADRAAGGRAILLPIAPDEPKRLRELIRTGWRPNLLLLAGGVSIGKMRSGGAGPGNCRTGVFLYRRADQPANRLSSDGSPVAQSAATASRGETDLLVSHSSIFFGFPGKSGFDHGDL